MSGKLKRKTALVISSVLITAATAAFAVYAGARINAVAPGSFLVQAVPVGVSTMQQILLMAWSEFTGHIKEASTTSQS